MTIIVTQNLLNGIASMVTPVFASVVLEEWSEDRVASLVPSLIASRRLLDESPSPERAIP
jgi:hypothetical protein